MRTKYSICSPRAKGPGTKATRGQQAKATRVQQAKGQQLTTAAGVPAEHPLVSGLCCSSKAVLVGLHTCGDLGPTVIKAFLRCENAAALLNVGCAFIFGASTTADQWLMQVLLQLPLSISSEGHCRVCVRSAYAASGLMRCAAADVGFPLSAALKRVAFRPTRTGSLMLAGQAVHRWSTQSGPKSAGMYKAHFYRAVLQVGTMLSLFAAKLSAAMIVLRVRCC